MKNTILICNTIDGQHERILEMLDHANHHINTYSIEKTKKIIHEIVVFVKNHFRTEENFMIDIDYPLYDEHHLDHSVFSILLEETVRAVGNSDEILSLAFYVRTITSHLMEHLKINDAKLAAYCANIKL